MIDEEQLNQFNVSKASGAHRGSLWRRGKVIGLCIAIIAGAILAVFAWRILYFYKLVRGGAQVEFTRGSGFTVDPRGARADTQTQLAKADIEQSASGNFGNPKAAVTIVQFADFECPFSRTAFPAFREFMTAHKDEIRFFSRQFPISEIHPHAQKAAEASLCANDQGKFWAMYDKLYQNQSQLTVSDLSRYAAELGLDVAVFYQCLSRGAHYKDVLADYAAGSKAGVRGTPTFFVNGQKVEGTLTRADWEQLLTYFK